MHHSSLKKHFCSSAEAPFTGAVFFFNLTPLWSRSRGSWDLMSIYLELTKINIQPRKRSECAINRPEYCLTLTGGRHRRWCSTQTRSRTDTKCPRQKHPRKLQIKSYIRFTIHLCPSLSISDLESHCRTYPLTSWPCGWFSPSQFLPFCWLYAPRTQDTRSLLYSSVHSTLQCPSSSVQERLPHNCGFPPPLPCWCWCWSAVQLLAAVTMQPPQQPRHHNLLSTYSILQE